MPKGAFYAFQNIKSTNFTSKSFTDFMLEKEGILACHVDYLGKYEKGV